MLRKSRAGSLPGEEKRLGNLRGHWCPVPEDQGRLLDGDTVWTEVTAGEDLAWEVLCSSCAAESLCVRATRDGEWGIQRGLDGRRPGRGGYALSCQLCSRGTELCE